jgi:hypothetical protein
MQVVGGFDVLEERTVRAASLDAVFTVGTEMVADLDHAVRADRPAATMTDEAGVLHRGAFRVMSACISSTMDREQAPA